MALCNLDLDLTLAVAYVCFALGGVLIMGGCVYLIVWAFCRKYVPSFLYLSFEEMIHIVTYPRHDFGSVLFPIVVSCLSLSVSVSLSRSLSPSVSSLSLFFSFPPLPLPLSLPLSPPFSSLLSLSFSFPPLPLSLPLSPSFSSLLSLFFSFPPLPLPLSGI